MYQNKVTATLTAIQMPGHWRDHSKMVYFVLTILLVALQI